MGQFEKININGVSVVPLTYVDDQRGDLFHITKDLNLLQYKRNLLFNNSFWGN